MDFNQFFQLFKRHILLLLLVPFVLAVTVYLFTRNQPKSYSSETKIYTGIATGYSIESTEARFLDYYGTNVQFDLLINLFFSRQTIEQTAIRLLAQDLCLEQPNAQYISKQNWEELQRFVPKYVKDLVVKNGKMGLEREKEEQIRELESEIRELEKAINKKKTQADFSTNGGTTKAVNESNTYIEGLEKSEKEVRSESSLPGYHTVAPGENIYTIASKYDISIGEIIEKNNLNSNRLEPGQVLTIEGAEKATKNQYHTVQPGESLYSIARRYGVSVNELRQINKLKTNNLPTGTRLIISESYFADDEISAGIDGKETNQTLSERTGQINEDGVYINPELNYKRPAFDIPRMNKGIAQKDPTIPPGVNPNDYWATVNNFNAYYRSSDDNFIYELLNYNHKHYSIQKIRNNTRVNRIQNSDLILITFSTDDPGICQQTLKILAEVFINNYKVLRINQTDAVVQYFQEQVDSANAKLQRAEDRLLQFNKKNNIINYYEQSKAIAGQKEDLDVFHQNEQIRLASAAAALNELETNLQSKDSIFLASDEMQRVRQKLQKVEEKIFINSLDAENDPRIGKSLDKLKLEAQHLRDQMKFLVDKYYMYSHSPEGIPVKELLTEWLENVLTFEESKAALNVIRRRKEEFATVYRIMAPLGATLKRIEREINVAEESYLDLLRSLNLAKMKQQNLEMATNIKIVDEPFFPIAPNPSKAKLLVLIAAVIGFVMVAFLILMLEYFDTSIKSPERAKNLTNLRLAGAFPRFGPGNQSPEFKSAVERLLEIVIQNMKLALGHQALYPAEKPYLILIFSTKPEVGKTTLATNLIRKLRSYGEKVLYLNYHRDNESEADDDFNYTIKYKIDNRFIEIKHVQDLIKDQYLRQDNYKYDYIFLEIPSIIYNSYPLELMDTIDLSLLVLKAQDHWQKADAAALDTLLQISREKPMVVLNQAEVYALEDIMHGVPQQKGRSIRKRLRTIITYPSRLKVRVKVD